ncbi:MAG: hypothetical protein ACYSUD_04460 [Planctomycetota bacterium]|jgi:hypothetical protein
MAKPVKIKKRGVSATPRVGDSAAPEQEIKPLGRTAFSGWPMIIGWLAMLVFTVHACTHMVAAGDTWVAMACGRHFVNHGVDTVEPFSANSHKAGPTEAEIGTWPDWAQWIADKAGIERVKYWHPTGWVNQNWLTHVIFYSLVPKSSYADGVSFSSNALVYWKFAIYIITVICVYYTGRLLGANPALCAIFSCFAMFTGRSFLDVRPAGFSNMLVAVFLLILVLATYRNILYIWLIVPVTVFWCNVHGGYIYVFIVLTAFVGLNLPTGLHTRFDLFCQDHPNVRWAHLLDGICLCGVCRRAALLQADVNFSRCTWYLPHSRRRFSHFRGHNRVQPVSFDEPHSYFRYQHQRTRRALA